MWARNDELIFVCNARLLDFPREESVFVIHYSFFQPLFSLDDRLLIQK